MGHTIFFGSETISTARDPLYTKIGTSSKLIDFVIWPFSWAIAHSFLAPETISTARVPRYTKIGTTSKLIDLVISRRFRGL